MKNWKDVLCDETQWNQFLADHDKGCGRVKLQKQFDLSERGVRNLMDIAGDEDAIASTREAYLGAMAQKYRDKFNSTKRSALVETRYGNAIEDLLSELRDAVSHYDFSKYIPMLSETEITDKVVGILQLSDLHLNECVELVDTLGYNDFGYAKACLRLKKFTEVARRYFDAECVTHVLVANTGDILNSDRRLDEKLTNSGNRSKAMIIAVDLLKQLLLDLAKDYKVTYITVAGNESRKYDDLTYNTVSFSNNYDVDIHTILSYLLEKTNNIEFKPLTNAFEILVEVNGNNIVFIHGQQLKPKDPEHSIIKLFAKYSQAGYKINFVICGHVHSTYASDFFARSASLVGDNAYTNNCLLLTGKAAQNLFIVRPKSINTITVDLQDVTEQKTTYDYDIELSKGTTQMKSRKKTSLFGAKEIVRVIV